jgi:transposase
MPKSHPPSSAEFRAEAIRLVRTSGKTKTAMAQDLGSSLAALRAWRRLAAPGGGRRRQAELDAGERHDGLTSEELGERRRRRREKKILREEREMLVQAAAVFGSPFARETTSLP